MQPILWRNWGWFIIVSPTLNRPFPMSILVYCRVISGISSENTGDV